jgi:uncharacterized protein (TIGR03437 family)
VQKEDRTVFRWFKMPVACSVALLTAATAFAQISASAYRVLGQQDLQHNGLNLVQGLELYSPSSVALDSRNGQLHLYIADTHNSRILAWQDVNTYQTGDAPTLVLAQPDPQSSNPLGIGAKGLNAPVGLAVDPTTGNLFVADFGDNRVVRFPSPFANPTRIEPDAVYGQPNFASFTALPVAKNTLNKPRSVAVDDAGNLWVADTGNNRVVRFGSATLNSTTPPDADTVIGQKDLTSGGANQSSIAVSASGFDTPVGLTFDAQNNLYVADLNNTRVLKFAAPLGPTIQNPAAVAVWGEADFKTRGVPAQASNSTLAGPAGISVDANNLYVAVPADNRVVVFPLSGKVANNVLGQPDFSTTALNSSSFPFASQNTLAAPSDAKVDANGNIYVADAGNNRVLLLPAGSKSAIKVWGQTDFASNGPNQVKAVSINSPFKMAIDYSAAPFALYVSDTNNNRVLVWKDSARFRTADPADMVIGQPDLRTTIANVDTKGSQTPSKTSLSAPTGIVVNQSDGSLYVADAGNNRVLRFPRPVAQAGRITPDAVLGQVDFASATSASVTASTLRSPTGLSLGPGGELFVADTGNNRVMEFAAGAGTGAAAMRVYGQPNNVSSTAPSQVSAQTLSAPQGLYVDRSLNLYVADTGANRILIFPNTQAAPAAGMTAAFVIGQGSFDNSTSSQGTAFKSPTDVAVDSNGNIFVSDFGGNRVLMFPSLVFLPVTGAVASSVVGQRSVSGTAANWDSTNGFATAQGLYGPLGIFLDRQDTLYVGDTGNNRVVQFLKAVAVVNGATYQNSVPVGQGALASLFGAGLAGTTETASAAPWPATLANRQIVVNDNILAPVYYLGPIQANFQVPTNAPQGTSRVAVRTADTAELIAGGSLVVASVSPGLYTLGQDGKGQAAATNQDSQLNNSSNPALRGSVITLYGTGQGQVSPAVPDGFPAPSQPLANTVTVPTSDAKTCVNSQPSMCVAIGNSFGTVQFSGLAPGFVGLWQINVIIPQDVTPGNVNVRVLINGTPSNLVSIAVR